MVLLEYNECASRGFLSWKSLFFSLIVGFFASKTLEFLTAVMTFPSAIVETRTS